MVRSRKIFVLKRDGTVERFDFHKLRGCLLRALAGKDRNVLRAGAIAAAVEWYLAERRQQCVSSAALLEMVLRALHAVGWQVAATRLEGRHNVRAAVRGRLALRHPDGQTTVWSKQWLVEHACSRWSLGRTAGRILAGQIENRLVDRRARRVDRSTVMEMLGRLVVAYGLGIPLPAETADRLA